MAVIPIVDEHRRRNTTTQGLWDAMAPHRAMVMQIVAEARGKSGETLCVLGPGNGNDIELASLARDFEKVALIDLDEAALARAVARLDEDGVRRLQRVGSVDLSGILPVLQTWVRHRNPTHEEITAVVRSARDAPRPGVGDFDVVASTCMLTQLIDSVYMALPMEHPRCIELLMAVRNRHLAMILELLNPGGVGILVTDFAASGNVTEIAQLDTLLLPQATMPWINERDFYPGTNPFEIRDYYNRLCQLGSIAVEAQVKGPWRWNIGERRFAVCAVIFRRSAV